MSSGKRSFDSDSNSDVNIKKTRSSESSMAAEESASEYEPKSPSRRKYRSSPSYQYEPKSPSCRKYRQGTSPSYRKYGAGHSPSYQREPNSPSYHPKPNSDEVEEAEEINSGSPSSNSKPSEPLFPALWGGDFSVETKFSTTSAFRGINACLSGNASTAARRVVELFPATIKWKRVARSSVWPKSFESRSRPTGDDVTVFFFPSLTKHEADYDSLVFDLIRRDEALRAQVIGRKSELLVFTSVELPHHAMRFHGKLFLWGVIRGTHLY